MSQAIAAISALGFSHLSRQYDYPVKALAHQAVKSALCDAGLRHTAIDGLLINRSPVASADFFDLRLQEELGLPPLKLLAHIDAEGSSAVQMVQMAALAIERKMASYVLCLFADTPLMPGVSAGNAFGVAMPLSGIPGWEKEIGLLGAAGPYALACKRHMITYGTTHEQLGHVALSARAWAIKNPLAFLQKPLTLEAYLASPWIVEPFRLLDCAYPVNGAIAFLVTSPERAKDLAKAPVYIHGMGQGHSSTRNLHGFSSETETPARQAAETAYQMAGVAPGEIDFCEIYDAFTYSTIVALEDYGFCPKGEGGPFVQEGHIAPGGTLPVNTGGGQLSGYYLQGVTPLSEGVIQLRGEGGERQVKRHDLALITGSGGRLEYTACLVASPQQSL